MSAHRYEDDAALDADLDAVDRLLEQVAWLETGEEAWDLASRLRSFTGSLTDSLRLLQDAAPATLSRLARRLAAYAKLAGVVEQVHRERSAWRQDALRTRNLDALLRTSRRESRAPAGTISPRAEPGVLVLPEAHLIEAHVATRRSALSEVADLLAGSSQAGAPLDQAAAPLDQDAETTRRLARAVASLWSAEAQPPSRPGRTDETAGLLSLLHEVLAPAAAGLARRLEEQRPPAAVERLRAPVGVGISLESPSVADGISGTPALAGLELECVQVRARPEDDHGATLETLSELLARCGPGVSGRYVVSPCESAADVLRAVSEGAAPHVVGGRGAQVGFVPLFESMAQLRGGADLVDELLSDASYRRLVASNGDFQEVMAACVELGKEVGVTTAEWAVERADELLHEVAERHGVQLSLVRAETAMLGDAGSSWLEAARARALRTVRLEQPLTLVSSGFVLQGLARRDLEQCLAGVLDAHALTGGSGAPTRVSDRWRAAMDVVSEEAAGAYAAFVEHPGVPRYFRQSSPVEESSWRGVLRPVRRVSGAVEPGIESIESLPWVTGWRQSRQYFHAFYGMGAGLAAARSRGLGGVLGEMYEGWPFFRALVRRAEAGLARASMPVASGYVERLVDPLLVPLFDMIVEESAVATREILAVTGAPELLGHSPLDRRALRVAAACLEPLHRLQVALLWRMRAAAPPDPLLREALRRTVEGIACAQ